ncbi:MAG: hypothetical protein AAFN70_16800, partial [Planctomycetota bacterium]
SPFAFGGQAIADLINVTRARPQSFKEKSLVDSPPAVVIIAGANLSGLSERRTSLLAQYVESGGALLVFPGDRTDPDKERGNPLLVSNWGTLQQRRSADLSEPPPDSDPGGGNATAASIGVQFFDHPALASFNNPENGDLSVAEIYRWFNLASGDRQSTRPDTGPDNAGQQNVGQQTAIASNDASSRATVIARLDTGDPFLSLAERGKGILIQCSTSADADWNSLPLRPTYLPLMQQIVTFLATRNLPSTNVEIGSPLVVGVPSETENVTVISPDGTKSKVNAQPLVGDSSRLIATFSNTFRPGVYTFRTNDRDAASRLCILSNPAEGDLRSAKQEDVAAAADSINAGLHESVDDYLTKSRRSRYGREIWRYFLLGLVALMTGEVFLQQRFGSAGR